jgi:hypothetical protein
MHRRRKSLISKEASAERKFAKIMDKQHMDHIDHKELQQQFHLMNGLGEDIRAIDTEVASLGDWKRIKAREWMSVLFGGLLECSEKGTVVATLGHAIIGRVPTETTQLGLPRACYSGQSQLENPAVEAERRLENISYVGEVSDQAERPSNENHTGGILRHRISHSNPLVQPTARPLPHHYVSSAPLDIPDLPPPWTNPSFLHPTSSHQSALPIDRRHRS